jgi:hypothetical protein
MGFVFGSGSNWNSGGYGDNVRADIEATVMISTYHREIVLGKNLLGFPLLGGIFLPFDISLPARELLWEVGNVSQLGEGPMMRFCGRHGKNVSTLDEKGELTFTSLNVYAKEGC